MSRSIKKFQTPRISWEGDLQLANYSKSIVKKHFRREEMPANQIDESKRKAGGFPSPDGTYRSTSFPDVQKVGRRTRAHLPIGFPVSFVVGK